MECHSRNFLLRLKQKMADYDYVLLDFLPSHIRKSHAHYHLDLLVSKSHYKALLSVLTDAESLHFLRTRMHRHAQEIELVFNDLSHLSVSLRTRLHFRGLKYDEPSEVFSSLRFEDGFKVPSFTHTFEYHLLKSLSEKTDFPNSYSEYFSHCSFEERSAIFAGIVPKFKFVINMLDDLMHYKSKNYRLVKQSLLKQTSNKGIGRLNRWAAALNGMVSNLMFGRWNYYYHTCTKEFASHHTVIQFLASKAYLRTG